MADQAVHPRATVLVVALEVIAVPERERSAVGIGHFEHAHVRVVDGNVFALFEGDSVKLRGRVENAVLQDVIQLEVWLDLRFVEIVLRLAHLVRVKLPVPGFELEAAVLLVDESLNVLGFSVCLGGCPRNQGVHELQG